MIASLRQKFNSQYTAAGQTRFHDFLERRFGEPAPFRLSETPCFLRASLVEQAARAGREMVEQLLQDDHYAKVSSRAIPAAYDAPNEPARPLFVQADFGLDQDRKLKLVEIQGFPSLYGYQPDLLAAYRAGYDIDDSLADLPNGLESDEYVALLRRAIVGQEDPATVALLEIDPWHQKTRHDFTATAEMLGIAVVDARAVVKHGRKLFYRSGRGLAPIKRIYNRVIADEVERLGITLPFSFRDELDLEWAGHPNWFFRLSKFSLPFLRHETVPESIFLDAIEGRLENPEAWVLKPLYSFAGKGVVVAPTQADLDAIPESERRDYLLQRRVDFAPWIVTPEGPTKLEIRVMYVWLEQLQALNLVIRMGRGAQMGVDHNKDMGWVGASAAFIESGA